MTGARFAAALVLAGAGAALAADWPQFKGPNASGVSAENNLPEKWGKADGLRWKAALPSRGISCPVVVGDRVYVTCSSGPRQDRLHVLCFDTAAGKQLWHRQLAATGGTACHAKSSMAAPTPAADATGVYALFATGDLAAFDPDGGLRWYRSLAADYPGIANQLGLAASPVLVSDRLVVPMESVGESYLVAVDTKYGKNVWKVDRPKSLSWVTPLVRGTGAETEVLLQGGRDLSAYDMATGAKRWAYKDGTGTSPTATLVGDRLFAPGGGVAALKLTAKGADATPEWKAAGFATGYSSPLVYDGHVYVTTNQGVVTCGDAKTGKVVWKDRIKGTVYASPVGGAGKVYLLNDAGVCTVIKAGGDAMEVLSINELGEETMATPALSGGAVFLRTDKSLYCIGGK